MRYETTTKLEPAEALQRAEQFFAGQFGLTMRRHDPRAIGFEGGGGHVVVAVTGERPTTLDLQTREWDEPVQEFMQQLPR
jgi:hypothetical protein